MSRAEWLAQWVAENRGLCRVCDAAEPSADPLHCPTGCDLEPAYQRGNFRSIGGATPLALAHETAAKPPQRPRARSLAELLADPELTRAPRFVVPGLVEEGCVTLVSGRPKEGKSTLASQVAADFTRGRAALDGSEVAPGKVLWIALDEPTRRLVQRLSSFDPDPHLFRIFERPRDRFSAAWFAELLDQEAPDLVVVDTLSQWGIDNGIKANEGDLVGPFLKPIVHAIQSRSRCGGLFIFHAPHHANRAAGSFQWEANVDAALVLRRRVAAAPKPGTSPDDTDDTTAEDGRRVLMGVTRWGGPLRLDLTYSDGRYSVGAAPAPLVERVRWYLKTTVAGIGKTSASAIATALRVRDASVTEVVRTLLEREEIERVTEGGKSYLKPKASMNLYTGRAPEEAGGSGEEEREEEAGSSAGSSSRIETPTRSRGKSTPAPAEDDGYLSSLFADEAAVAAEEVFE